MTEFRHSMVIRRLESRRSCQDVACYRPHTHERFSIGVIDSGSTVFTGAAGSSARLEAGDVVLIPAGNVHACNPDRGRWRYQMIQADQGWIAGLLAEGADSRLLEGITVFRQRSVHRRFSRLNDLLFDDADVDADRIETEFRHALHDCARRDPDWRMAPAVGNELPSSLRPVLQRLRDDETNPRLDELAELAGMDRFQLIRAMKRATGMAPLAWRQNRRIIAAREMLREGRSQSETAHVLGFADQSHFHRVFRAHVAASPGAYRG